MVELLLALLVAYLVVPTTCSTQKEEVSALCDIYTIDKPLNWPSPCNWTTPCEYTLDQYQICNNETGHLEALCQRHSLVYNV